MGLDMYLNKKVYVGAEYEHRKVTGAIDIKSNDEIIPVDFKKVSEIVEQVGYWRKANAIHKWFVDNVQDGEDNCRESYVEHGQLMELKETCEKVLASLESSPTKKTKVKTGYANGKDTYTEIDICTDTTLAEELLPSESGFFFGSTEYGECYLEDLKTTIDILTDLNEGDDYYYRASW